MKKVDKYVLKELAVPMVVGIVIIALLFMANEFIAVFKNFEITHLPFVAILQMVIYRMPEWLSLTLPSGTAIGVALAVSRLARESEITAMRAAGMPIRRVFLPIMVVGLLVSVANFFIIEKLIPPAAKQYHNVINQGSMVATVPAFKSDVMLRLDRFTANFGTIRRMKDGTVALTDILIIERPKAGDVVLYVAETGTYDDGIWTFNEPYVWWMRGTELVASYSRDQVEINERIRVGDLFQRPAPEEETVADLRAAIERGRASKSDTTLLEIAYHVKFSLPASCFVFAITAAALAVSLTRAGPFVGLIASMVLVMLFYNIHIVSTQIFGPNDWLPPFLAAWLPSILYTIVAVVLLWRSE